MANDFKFGSKAITDLYFGSKAVLQVYFGSKLIWEKIGKQLVAGTQFVSFEFIPTEDITLDHIGIFTSDAYTGTTINFAIYHESGLVVAKTNADSAQSTEEKYGLTGQRRIVAVNGVLKRGLKYYIQYTDGNGNTIHPAYFQNSQSSETGETGKYKVFTHNQAQDKSIADLSNVSLYIGVVSDINNFITATAGALMICNGIDNYSTNYAYIRNNLYHESYTSIGNGNNLTLAFLDAILDLDDGSMFYWNGGNASSLNRQSLWYREYHRRVGTTYSKSNYKGILSLRAELLDPSYTIGDYGCLDNGYGQLYIYRKTDDVEVDEFLNLNADKYTGKDLYKTADIIMKSYNSNGNKSIMTQGKIYAQDVNSYIFTLKTGYSYDFTVDASGNVHGYNSSHKPSQLVQNCIYYFEDNDSYGGIWANAGFNMYNGGSSFVEINMYGNYGGMDKAFDIETNAIEETTEEISLADMTQELGNASIFRTNEVYSTNYISEGLRSASVEQDTKKFYLEINGVEK